MNSKDKQIYLKRYDGKLIEFGYDTRSLGWSGGKERQSLRFKVLHEIGIQKDDSVMDVGCGFADMFGYLKSHGWNGKYLGIDINPALLTVAKTVYPDVHVSERDILLEPFHETFDWVVSSGLFSAKLQYEDNLSYIKKMLERMWKISKKGVASDFMSTFVDYRQPDTYHADPCEIIRIGKMLTSRVLLRLDYLPYEYALYLLH